MDKIEERENALDFIANSPEIALKMMERMEKDADKLKKALNETRKELRQTKKDLIQARQSAENYRNEYLCAIRRRAIAFERKLKG